MSENDREAQAGNDEARTVFKPAKRAARSGGEYGGGSGGNEGGGATKILSGLLIAGALFFVWRMAGPSSALAWNNDLDIARAEAVKTNKPILIYFTADWCPPCREFKKNTLTDSGVAETLQREWVLLKIDLTERGGPNAQLAQTLGVSSIPTFQVYDVKGQPFETRGGYAPPAPFLAWLQTCKARMK